MPLGSRARCWRRKSNTKVLAPDGRSGPPRSIVTTQDRRPFVATNNYPDAGTGWFVGIIAALALLAIGYLVFSASYGPYTSVATVETQ